jgi:gliding motility-associated-like protein
VLCRSTYTTFYANYTAVGNTGITWNFGNGDSILNVNPVQHAFDGTGNFMVTATAHFRACRDTSVSKLVTVYQMPSLDLADEYSICPGSESLVLADNLNINTAHTSWLWSTGATTPGITVVEPGVYTLTVNISGCINGETITVKNDCYMNIPNVFTPNNDGLNDYFFPRQYLTSGLTTFSMSIYNRWGQLVFESASLDGRGWDGKFNGVDQIEGVYVYIIDATFKDGQKEHHQGNVTLLR